MHIRKCVIVLFYVLQNRNNLVSGRKLSMFFQNTSETDVSILELSKEVEENSEYTLEELYEFIGEENTFIFDVPLDIKNEQKNIILSLMINKKLCTLVAYTCKKYDYAK